MTSIANLYLALDDTNTNNLKYLEKTANAVASRHQKFKALINNGSALDALYDLVFPDNLPFTGFVSNRSREHQDPRYAQMAIRPQINSGREWPFSNHSTFIAMGSWHAEHPAPLFLINNFIEAADLPARHFEREITAFAVHDRLKPIPGTPRIQRTNNLLSPQLLVDLPPISLETGRQLTEWRTFLDWKRKLVQHKTRGLRYINREWRENRVIFHLVAESDKALKEAHHTLRRQDVVAFETSISEDQWTFRLPEKVSENKRELRGTVLGQVETLKSISALSSKEKLPNCDWTSPIQSKLAIPVSEKDQNEIDNAADPESVRERILRQIPQDGFLSISNAGDISLINRHKRALDQLENQGGYAPYLTSYLFEVAQASVPEHLERVDQWHRTNLNPTQKAAVVKILSAPDLCLIQGPPGTGKTTVIAEAIVQLVRRGQRVLLASQAHTAVDNALGRLGQDANLRIVRLARNEDRISEEGKQFVGAASLQGYYTSLAEQTKSRLDAWQRNDRDLEILQAWLERARFVHADEQSLRAEGERLAKEHQQAIRQLTRAEQQYEQAFAIRDEKEARRRRLLNLRTLIQDPTHPYDGSLRDLGPEVDALVYQLLKHTAKDLEMRFTQEDWRADIASQGGMLKHMLVVWQRFLASQEAITADATRLQDAQDGPMQDAETKLRIEACRRDVAALAERMENDDAFVPAWRAKRKELKELEQTNVGLDHARYEGLFRQATAWCRQTISEPRTMTIKNWLPWQTSALHNSTRSSSDLGTEIAVSLSRLQQAKPAIESAQLRLLQALKTQLGEPVHEPEDSAIRTAQEYERHTQKMRNDWETRWSQHQQKIASLLTDEAITGGNRLPQSAVSNVTGDALAQSITFPMMLCS